MRSRDASGARAARKSRRTPRGPRSIISRSTCRADGATRRPPDPLPDAGGPHSVRSALRGGIAAATERHGGRSLQVNCHQAIFLLHCRVGVLPGGTAGVSEERSMPETFDPYHTWLGIPPEQQPPNHYRLLAIEAFESNPDVIESAADQRMAHLRSFQTGRRRRSRPKCSRPSTGADRRPLRSPQWAGPSRSPTWQ